MRGLEKLNYLRLSEILSQSGLVEEQLLKDTLQESRRSGMPFPEILIKDKLAGEWDLCRMISKEFSLPILFPKNYVLDNQVLALIPPVMIRNTHVLPLDRFGKTLIVAMPLMVEFSVLEEIRKMTQMEISPYVSPVTQVRSIIEDKLPEPQSMVASGGSDGEGWEKLFDEADQEVQAEQSKLDDSGRPS